MRIGKGVVVFCSDVFSSLGLIRSLGEAGYRPECYCYGTRCQYILSSKYIKNGFCFKSASDILNYFIHDYPCLREKPILFTIPDLPAYLVDLNYDELKRKFVIMSAGEQGKIGFCMDKGNQSRVAKKHGLEIPWAMELSREDMIPQSIDYPVFTKSIRTVDGGKCDEGICWNEEELANRLSSMASDRILIMKYIKKKKEIDFFGLSINGKVYIDYHDEISRFPDGAYGYYGIFDRNGYDEIRLKCISMMEDYGYEGLFDVEFLLGEDDVLYFMEVNFRVDGAIYKLTPGVNLPAEWCRLVCMDKEKLPRSLKFKKDSFTGMTEIYDFKTSVLTKQVNPFKWLWQLCNADKHMLINLRDPIPFFVWAYIVTLKFFKNS